MHSGLEKMRLSEGFVRITQFCNRFNFPGSSRRYCKPFFIDDKQVGLIRPNVLAYLQRYPTVFTIENNPVYDEVDRVSLASSLKTFDEKTSHVSAVLEDLKKEDDDLVSLAGWRNEDYNVWHRFSEPPLMKMERTAACLFGIKQYGVHINGYLYDKSRGLCMWIAKRSKTKQTWPGKLDQMVAGGLACNQTILECAHKECKEEASVPDHILTKLKPVGTVSYFYEDERGLFPECQFIMDLEVPKDFQPVCADGEAESFELMPIDTVKQRIITEDFKFNCAVVALDFLIRHGLVTPDEEPNYSSLVEGMHVTLS